ncbi:MAG: hypothetical protein R2911_10665 [Caldilineaceae bacterium]
MSVNTPTIEQLVSQAQLLSVRSRLQLIERLVQTVIASQAPEKTRLLRFGEMGGDVASMSSPEDFAIAEWRPTNEELDGPQVHS